MIIDNNNILKDLNRNIVILDGLELYIKNKGAKKFLVEKLDETKKVIKKKVMKPIVIPNSL